MKRKTILAICLLATVLTAAIVLGARTITSNYLSGTSGATPALTLTGNTSGASFIGDIFHLVVTLTNWPVNGGVTVQVNFFNNGVSIGSTTSGVGATASIDWLVNDASWNLSATASF